MQPQWVALVAVLLAASLRVGAARPSYDAAPPGFAVATVASLGHETLAASGVWMRTVDLFVAEAIETDRINAGVRTATALDPNWRIPWVYGALMLQAQGDYANQEALLYDAMAFHPHEAWFPYALGMSRLEHYNDPQGAADWLDHAASMPGSPDVHSAAAKALRGLQ